MLGAGRGWSPRKEEPPGGAGDAPRRAPPSAPGLSGWHSLCFPAASSSLCFNHCEYLRFNLGPKWKLNEIRNVNVFRLP